MIVLDTNIAAQGATTQYTSFDFNSISKMSNKFFCAGDSGLYRLEGTSNINASDDATYSSIESYFELPTMDFGISGQKRFRSIYVGYEATGNLTLKISTELSAVQTYTLSATTLGRYARKVSINRTLKGRYWTIQIYGTGVTFAIDEINILPIVRGHGFDQN